MRLEPAQIVRSAQVWVCRSCGGEDPKSCGCSACADPREIEARAKEKERQRARVNREKAKENQTPRTDKSYAYVENVEEFPVGEIEDVPTELEDSQVGELVARKRGFLYRASECVRYARYESFDGLKADEEMMAAARQAIAAWTETLKYLEQMHAQDKAA